MFMEGLYLYFQVNPAKKIKMKMSLCAGIAWGKQILCWAKATKLMLRRDKYFVNENYL